MRPLKLKLQAFGSYVEPITLNFEKDLHGEKIFLIHGATGAGKTTILDAICYALYGAASGKDRDGAMMRSKGAADNVAMKVEFKFELGDKIYKIHRELIYHPKRQKNQFTPTAELICGEEVLERQSANVTAKVKELLGFDVDQFRQIVLLPQGEFRKFLFAKAEDRQPVLDALFNAEYYQKIQDAIERRFKTCEDELKDLNKRKGELEAKLQGASVDDEALAKLAAEFVDAQKKTVALKKIFDTASEDFNAGQNLSKDFDTLEKKRDEFDRAQKNLEQAEKSFAAAQDEYDRRDGEKSRRENLNAEIKNLSDMKTKLDDLNAKREKLSVAQQNLQDAKDKLKTLEEKAKYYDELLATRKKQRDAAELEARKLDKAQQLFDRVCERDGLQREISQLESSLKSARQKLSVAEQNFNAAKIKVERLQKLQHDGSAARLAKTLRDGEPCPVCGSRIHYPVDFGEENIPSDDEIKAAQVDADKLQKKFDAAKISVANIETTLTNKREDLKKFVGLPTKADAEENLSTAKKAVTEFDKRKQDVEKGKDLIAKNNEAINTARQEVIDKTGEYKQILGVVQSCEQQIPEKYRTDSAQLDAEISATRKTLRKLETAWNSADENFRNAGNQKSSFEATFTAAEKAFRELDDKLKDKTPPDVDELKRRKNVAQQNHEAAIRHEEELKHKFDELKKLAAQFAELEQKISEAQKKFALWQKLSDVASGKISGKKISFVRYYLRAMFAEVLTEANYRLDKMSGQRYELRQKDAGNRATSAAGLNLEIYDEFNDSSRPVATLSGGESFLASLALALGLAAVVRNNLGGIKLDTIFIDEGFGSLDTETLYFAISTIIKQSGNRLVGIISHVEDLKNQMPVRLEVFKTKTGSKAEFKYGINS